MDRQAIQSQAGRKYEKSGIMKILKITLMCLIPVLGVFSMSKIQFGEKLVIMLPGQAPVRRPGGPQGPPPQTQQVTPQAPGADVEGHMPPGPEMEQERLQAPGTDGEQIAQGPPAGPSGEEQSKWRVRINFNRGIKNIGYLTLIMALIIELTYVTDRLIRRKPLV